MEEPVEYVGGLSDAKRPRAWPYLLLAGFLVTAAVAGFVFRNAILEGGHAFGESFIPYSLNLTASAWSSNDKLTGVPVTLELQIQNGDPRTVNGVTVRLTNLSQKLEIQGARPNGQIDGNSFFFPQVLAPTKSEVLAITILPTQAGDWHFGVTITPGHGSTPARVTTADGSTAPSLTAEASVRDATPADASASVASTWTPHMTVGGSGNWDLSLTNEGPIAISSVTLGFPQVPAGFEIVSAGPQASVLPDGRLRFVTSIPPGGQGTVSMSVIAHQAGQFQVPINVYLDDAHDPLTSPNGGPIVNLDISVS